MKQEIKANGSNPLPEELSKENPDAKKCIKCEAYIPAKAKKCMYCASSQRSMPVRIVLGTLKLLLAIWLVALILQGLVAVLAAGHTTSTSATTTAPAQRTTK